MVNVSDIKGDEIPTPNNESDMLDLMFQRQHELAIKYLPIEEANGLLQTKDVPVDIDDRHGQARLKDYAWRVQEELYEATDALVQHPDNPEHFLEEMIDSIHFFLELNILCGIGPKKVAEYYEIPANVDDKLAYLDLISQQLKITDDKLDKYIPVALLIYSYIGQPIGNAMNRLKNKPWKQTHMVTDQEAFIDCLMPAWLGYFKVLSKYGLSARDIFTLYFKKSEVNKFRIRSQY